MYCSVPCTRRASVKRVKERYIRRRLADRLSHTMPRKPEISIESLGELERIEPEPQPQRSAEEDDEQNPFAMLKRILGKAKDSDDQPRGLCPPKMDS